MSYWIDIGGIDVATGCCMLLLHVVACVVACCCFTYVGQVAVVTWSRHLRPSVCVCATDVIFLSRALSSGSPAYARARVCVADGGLCGCVSRRLNTGVSPPPPPPPTPSPPPPLSPPYLSITARASVLSWPKRSFSLFKRQLTFTQLNRWLAALAGDKKKDIT